MHRLYDQLCRFTRADWDRAVNAIAPEIHEIDRNATRIWFAFWPLELHVALAQAPDPAALARKLGLMGRYRLADQVDESHRFLFAHRFWPQVRTAMAGDRDWPADLDAMMRTLAGAAARTARVDPEMLLGIAAVGLMTLRQAGVEAFSAATGQLHLAPVARRRSPHQVLRRRAKDDWQGFFGFLRGLKRRWTVVFDESDPSASFALINGQEIATAAQHDKREYRSRDSRCTPGEGPIPVECRAASCGTCWVGVLAGAEKLSPVVERDEGRRMKVFGYRQTDEPKPLIRLACQARAFGSVSIVIPPWNGVFGSIVERTSAPAPAPADRT